jgi:hypothetical protein
MKKIILVVSLLIIINFPPNKIQASTLSCSDIDGMSIFGYNYDEWIHIGAIANEFNSLSIANEFGAGNEFKSTSIFNEYGKFGSDFSSYSAFNDYASKPPIIINNDYKLVGYLTIGYKTPSINTYQAIACAQNSYKSPNREMKDIIFKDIPSRSYGSTGYTTNQYSCPDNSHTSSIDITKCDCDAGYQINSTKDACVPIPIKSNDEICKDEFGGNVNWDGTKTEDGHLNCNCKSGFIWNTGRTACVVYTPPVSPTFPVGCVSGTGFSATTGLSCDGTNRCSDEMQLNSDKTECLEIPKPVLKAEKKLVEVENTKIVKEKIEVKEELKREEKIEISAKSENIVTVKESGVAKVSWYKRFWRWVIGN